jgi:hypothetical protein
VVAHNQGGGVDLRDAWGCTVTGNTFTIVAQRAVVVGPDSGRITITGNNFSDSYIGGKLRRKDAASGILLQGSSDIAITGNTFTGLLGPALQMEGDCRRIAFVGNVQADLFRDSEKKGPALTGNGERGIIVENNTGVK